MLLVTTKKCNDLRTDLEKQINSNNQEIVTLLKHISAVQKMHSTMFDTNGMILDNQTKQLVTMNQNIYENIDEIKKIKTNIKSLDDKVDKNTAELKSIKDLLVKLVESKA